MHLFEKTVANLIFFFLQVTYLHMDYSSDLQQLEPII